MAVNFISKYQAWLLGLNLPRRMLETEFLKTQAIKLWLWKRFIDDILFIWTVSEENLNKLLKGLNEFHPNLKFTYEKCKEKINFLDLVIKRTDGKIVTDLYCKPTDGHQYLHIMIRATQNTLKD